MHYSEFQDKASSEKIVPAFNVNRYKAKLRNVTDSTDTIIGSSMIVTNNSDNTMNASVIAGTISITSAKVFEIQHYAQATYSKGFGVESNFGVDEVYTVVKIEKVL